MLILYPILRANRYFNDDLKRALIGHTGWDSNGRPLTTLLMKLLQCYDSALVDVSPLTQILAVAVLAWSGVLIARRFDIRASWMAAIVAFPLGGQPFYLESLSFKFDSLSMSLAILLALLPVLKLGIHRRGWWMGVLALFGSLNFYQPAINVYLIFVLLEVVLAQVNDAPVSHWLKILLSRVMQAAVSMLLYQFIVGIHIHGWVGRKTQKISSLRELPLLGKNVRDFYRFIGDCFNQQWQIYFLPVLIILIAFPIYVGVRYAIKRRSDLLIWQFAGLILSSIILPVSALLCIAGPMLLLRSPEFSPRVLMGVGALLVAGLIVMQSALARWNRSPRWVLILGSMLALGMCSLASAYGNALGEQKAYEDRTAVRLADDLADLKATRGVRSFVLEGAIGFSPITAHVAEEFPIVNALITPYITSNDQFFTLNFFRYYIDGLTDLGQQNSPLTEPLERELLVRASTVPVSRTTTAYSLSVVGDVAVVTLHPAPGQSRTAKSVAPGVRSLPEGSNDSREQMQ